MEITSQTIATLVSPATTSIIASFLTPKLEEWKTKYKLNKELEEYKLGDGFKNYFERTFEKYSYVSTIIFENKKRQIKDLFIPLTVRSEGFKQTETVKIEDYQDNFIPNYKKILLKDTAGMGKSTLLKWLFLSAVEKNKSLPFFIELKRLTGDKDIIDEICNDLATIDKPVLKTLVQELIKAGEFIFFFDGYDEIQLSKKEIITKQLESFISKSNKNLFIISSRPESGLFTFNTFYSFRIEPLKIEESIELIKKYDNYGDTSNYIIQKINEIKQQNFNDFLSNPLLVTLLYRAFEYKQTIPTKKITFYRQVYDALFDAHDLTKGGYFKREKYSKLDIEDFHKVLRYLGFFTSLNGSLLYTKDEFIKFISDSKKYSGISFKEEAFLNDLITSVPIFVQDGLSYGWSHKAIQDYFTAQYIHLDSKEKQKNILLHLSQKSDKYYNILDLFYELDYKTFKNIIIYSIANNYIEYCRKSYLNINIEPKQIILRQSLTFNQESIILTLLVDDYDKELEDKIVNIFNGNFPESYAMENCSFPVTIYYTEKEHIPLINILQKRHDSILNLILIGQSYLDNIFKEINKKFLGLDENGNKDYLINISLDIKENKLFIINEDINSPINKNSNFYKINQYLFLQQTCNNIKSTLFDLNGCIKLIQEIDKEIKQENDFLNLFP